MTPKQIAKIRADHRQSAGFPWCKRDKLDWPCVVVQLLDELVAKLAHIDLLEASQRRQKTSYALMVLAADGYQAERDQERARAERTERFAAAWKQAAKLHRQIRPFWQAELTKATEHIATVGAERNALFAALAAERARADAAVAALRELADAWHDAIHGVEDSVEAMRACRKSGCAEARAILAAEQKEGS